METVVSDHWFEMLGGGAVHNTPETKPSIESHIVGDQNDVWVVGLCRFVLEEFDDND